MRIGRSADGLALGWGWLITASGPDAAVVSLGLVGPGPGADARWKCLKMLSSI